MVPWSEEERLTAQLDRPFKKCEIVDAVSLEAAKQVQICCTNEEEAKLDPF